MVENRFRALTQRTLLLVLFVGVLLVPSLGAAQVSAADKSAAEALFNEGRRLMDAGSYADACAKLRDSHRLDPGVGTLLNLGWCYKQNGQLASAWSTYKEAAAMARDAGQTDREQHARGEAQALEGSLSRLIVQVPPELLEIPDLEIKLDGKPFLRGLFGVPLPVDSGERTVVAMAPGMKQWTGKIDVQGTTPVEVVVPMLEFAPPPEEKEPPETAPAPPPEPATGPEPRTPGPALVADQGTGDTQRVAAVIVGGVGLVGLAVGTVFGISAKTTYEDADSHCTDDNVCFDEGLELRDEANKKAAFATVGFGVGLAGLAGGAILWFTAPSAERQATRDNSTKLYAGVDPSHRNWTLSLRGTW